MSRPDQPMRPRFKKQRKRKGSGTHHRSTAKGLPPSKRRHPYSCVQPGCPRTFPDAETLHDHVAKAHKEAR